MITTAEENLLRSLEQLVERSAKTGNRKEFKKRSAQAHEIAMGVIRTHQSMIGLWRAMDTRMQKRAKELLATK